MAISIDWATKVISIPQADLTFISGTTYDLDTNTFRLALKALEASSDGMAFVRTNRHATEVGPIVGVTYARTFEIINGYTVTFEDTGSSYTVRLQGSNNNLFDVDGGIMNPTPLVTVVPNNSAGLVVVSQSGLTPAESAALISIAADTATSIALQTGIEARDVGKHITNPVLGKMQIVNNTAMRRWEALAWEDVAETIPYAGDGLEVIGELTEIAY